MALYESPQYRYKRSSSRVSAGSGMLDVRNEGWGRNEDRDRDRDSINSLNNNDGVSGDKDMDKMTPTTRASTVGGGTPMEKRRSHVSPLLGKYMKS